MTNTKIEWADHTFNPWVGCAKVSPGCAHCYAETLMDHRLGKARWGKGQPRVRTSEANWKQPVKWNKETERTGTRPRVFCASLSDWLDDEVPAEWLYDLLALIHKTPNLIWLLLTKRPENFERRLKAAAAQCTIDPLDITDRIHSWLDARREWSRIPENVWIGASVEDQARADERIPRLLEIPARVRFLSCEPLLGPVDLIGSKWTVSTDEPNPKIGWVIAGGESGFGARIMRPEWARSLRDQCVAAGVPFHFKQWGEHDCRTIRMGKGLAGRELDGRTWDQLPTAS